MGRRLPTPAGAAGKNHAFCPRASPMSAEIAKGNFSQSKHSGICRDETVTFGPFCVGGSGRWRCSGFGSGMRSGVLVAAAVCLGVASAAVTAQEPAPQGSSGAPVNPQRGKELSYTCLGCHGCRWLQERLSELQRA